jgi:hypothetical protein
VSTNDATPPEAGECLACRGTGRLISGLGGEPHEVRCPWCEGTGTRIPGIDAQAHPAETGPRPERAAAETPARPAGSA